jgi:hypothetical protein
MDSAIVVLVVVVALVALDTIGRRDVRKPQDETSRTRKVVVDLTERDRE